MKQTAIEWFLSEFKKQVWFEPNSELDLWINDLIIKAKQMEKEQIINALMTSEVELLAWGISAEQYYNQTFKSE